MLKNHCVVHDSLDTNRDGMCIRYGTATREMRERMEECRYETDEERRDRFDAMGVEQDFEERF